MTQFEGMDRTHFDRVIVEAELKIGDFEINLERDIPEGKEKNEMGWRGTGTITVNYSPTGISSCYRYNVVPPGHFQFERELKMNLFKTP